MFAEKSGSKKSLRPGDRDIINYNLLIVLTICTIFNEGKTDNLYYFRDHKGNEIDILLDYGLTVDAVEVKAGQTINSDFFKGLEYFSRISDQVRNSFLVYGGT